MELAQIIQNINLAKLDNAKWVRYANALINGQQLSKEGIPTSVDECVPCQWLYAHSDEVSKLCQKIEASEIDFFHFDIMEEIEILRYNLHENYLQIFRTYLPEMNYSFFVNLFRNSKGPSQYDKIKAKRVFMEMKQTAEELDRKLDYLEQSLREFCQLNIA